MPPPPALRRVCEWHIHFVSSSSQKPGNSPGEHVLTFIHIKTLQSSAKLASRMNCIVNPSTPLSRYCHQSSPNHCHFLSGQLQVFYSASLLFLSLPNPPCMFRRLHKFPGTQDKIRSPFQIESSALSTAVTLTSSSPTLLLTCSSLQPYRFKFTISGCTRDFSPQDLCIFYPLCLHSNSHTKPLLMLSLMSSPTRASL